MISFGYLYGEADAEGVVPTGKKFKENFEKKYFLTFFLKFLGPLPYRTFVMLISLACHLAISTLTDYLFTEEKLNLKYDFFSCFRVR